MRSPNLPLVSAKALPFMAARQSINLMIQPTQTAISGVSPFLSFFKMKPPSLLVGGGGLFFSEYGRFRFLNYFPLGRVSVELSVVSDCAPLSTAGSLERTSTSFLLKKSRGSTESPLTVTSKCR